MKDIYDPQVIEKKSGVLRVVHMVPLGAGGITSMVLSLAEQMKEENVIFDYLTFRDQEEFNEKRALSYGGKKLVVPKDRFRNPVLRGIYKFWGTVSVLRKSQAQIIHVNASFPYDIVVGLSARIAGIKNVVFHSHNSDMPSFGRGKRLVMVLCRPLIPLISDWNVACSQKAAAFMFPRRVLKKHQYDVIRNGVDLNRYAYCRAIRMEARRALNLEDKVVIGHIGRFTEQKNHRFLLEIFREICCRNRDARLLLIGEGEMEKVIRDKTREMGLEGYVIFLGATTQVPRFLQAMDCFLFPSLYEGLPIAVIEAQAAGLPVVLSDRITREAEFAEHVKYLSLSCPAKTWADWTLKFCDIKEDRGKGAEALQKAGYDISSVSERILKGYRRLEGCRCQ